MRPAVRRLSLIAALMLGVATPTLAQSPFDAGRLNANIRELSDDSFEGRGIGGAAEDKVIAFMSERFAAAGFEPGGVDGGWTQPVELARFAVVDPVATLSVGDWSLPLRQGQEAVISTRRPADTVDLQNAELVFVGYGVRAPERNWDDFKGQDLRGKILVVLVNDADFEQPELNTFGGRAMTYYGRWTYKYEEAARQGAAGVLIVHETAPASYGWTTVANSWSGPQFDIVRANAEAERVPLESWIQRDVAVELFRRAGLDFEALKVAARSRDFQPVALQGARLNARYGVETSRIRTHNILARLPGATHPDETILYTAHWDHIGIGAPDASGDAIFNGAVDNASGTAALIEIAHAFSAGPRPARSVVLIGFTAEESGLLGSEYYAANPLYPLETTVAGFNMDAANVYGRVDGMSVTGYGQSDLDDRVRPLVEAQGRRLLPDGNPAAGTYFRSDHFPLAKRGVPMAYMRGGGAFRDAPIEERNARRDSYTADRYHQAGDEWSPDWDLSGQIEDLDVYYAAGRALADSRDWPAWRETSEFRVAREVSATARD
jgi:Zn-dependent M28 family amino/carboxypeptidase